MPNGMELYYQEGRDKVRSQDEHQRALINKAFNILSLSVALIVAGILMFTFKSEAIQDPARTIQVTEQTVIVGAIVLFSCFGVFLFCIWVIAPVDWHEGSKLASFADILNGDYSDEDLRWFLADNYQKAYESNRLVLDRLVANIKWAAICLLIQAGGIVAFASTIVGERI